MLPAGVLITQRSEPVWLVEPLSQAKSDLMSVRLATVVPLGGTWVRAAQSLWLSESEPMDLKLGTLVTVVVVVVSVFRWTVSDLVSLNCTGMTPRLAGQVEVPSGLMGCCTWALPVGHPPVNG